MNLTLKSKSISPTLFIWGCRAHRRFSELNSDSKNLRNWSRPAGSFSASSREKPHFFTRCWPGSRLLTQENMRTEHSRWFPSSEEKHQHLNT